MNWEDILLSVQKPSRYTGGEVNAIRKDRLACAFSIALAFPDVYEVGMSHLGLQILYAILNAHPQIMAERCYAPWPDMERQMRQHHLPLTTLESRTPLNRFDMVGFSLQYELSATNVLTMLDLGGVPLRAEDRKEDHPLIIAGGPCAFHPAPMARFIDAFVIGEGEEVIMEIALTVMEAKRQGLKRRSRLDRLAAIPGVYVPAVHTGNDPVRKRTVADINLWRFPLQPVVPLMQTIHNRVTLEIARGCTRGCRFCQAGMVWRPVRERRQAEIEKMACETLCTTGHDEVSLLALSAGDYSRIEPLLTTLMDRYHEQRIALALPSLRTETLTRSLMEEIKRVRKTSFTLAPEAGTQRLRDRINKGNTEADLLATASQIFAAGWKSLKLYFMIGLPDETQADMDGIVDLAHQVLREAKHRGQVTVSLSTFVPKPHTPFQWAEQISVAETLGKQAFFQKYLRNRNLAVKWHDARMSLMEGLISRGDERIGALIEQAFAAGCRFDGWSDHFRFDLWEKAMIELDIRPEIALRERRLTDTLPWQQIDCGLNGDFLVSERQKSLQGEGTPDCRTDKCHQCGVCDHKTIKRIIASERQLPPPDDALVEDAAMARQTAGKAESVSLCRSARFQDTDGNRTPGAPFEKRIRIRFTKKGSARFLSHLELSAALIRAIHQSGLHFAYSGGFHPHPKISFAAATAVGMESWGEYADIQILDANGTRSLPLAEQTGAVSPASEAAGSAVMARINVFLPEGMAIKALHEVPRHSPTLFEAICGFQYHFYLPEDIVRDAGTSITVKLNDFMASETFSITREAKGKTTSRDIRPLVRSLCFIARDHRIEMSLSCGSTALFRPSDILTKVCKLDEETLCRTRIVKTETFFR